MSRLATASTVIAPTPARENTASVMTAPPTSSPKVSPAMVIAGSTALRSTLRHSTHWAPAPRALTTVMKGMSVTSSMLRISTWASGADSGTASATDGRMRSWTLVAWITGIHSRVKLNSWMRMMPSQKAGRETNSGGSARSVVEIQRQTRLSGSEVAVTATRTAMTRATRKPVSARARVPGRASVRESMTSAPVCRELPKSRWRTPVSEFQ